MPSSPSWAGEPGWLSFQASLRDALPHDWMVPPTRPGWHLVSMEVPDRTIQWRVWSGGPAPLPEPISIRGTVSPPHPVASACVERARAAGEGVILLGVPSRRDAVGVEVYEEHRWLDPKPEKVLEDLLALAMTWEARRRPGRPWVTRMEHLAATRAREMAVLEATKERAEAEWAINEQIKADTVKRRSAWAVKRGHHVADKE